MNGIDCIPSLESSKPSAAWRPQWQSPCSSLLVFADAIVAISFFSYPPLLSLWVSPAPAYPPPPVAVGCCCCCCPGDDINIVDVVINSRHNE